MLDAAGGIRSDVTVARLGRAAVPARGQRAALDVDWLHEHKPQAASRSRDITAGTCAVGLWGPRAAGSWSGLVPRSRSTTSASSAPPSSPRRRSRSPGCACPTSASRAGSSPPTAELGVALWDTLVDAGAGHGLVAAGRHAFSACGWRRATGSWGADMTTEHDPDAGRTGVRGPDGQGPVRRAGRAGAARSAPAHPAAARDARAGRRRGAVVHGHGAGARAGRGGARPAT